MRSLMRNRLEAGGWRLEVANVPARALHSSLTPSPQPLAPAASGRSGVTLLELLIVMVILMMVTAAAIPIMAPALENRRMREAARMASSYISGARAKAIQRGREVGVMVQRFEGRPYAMTMSYVEVPPPYGGDITGAVCKVKVKVNGITDNLSSNNFTDYAITINFGPGFTPSLVRVGDQVRFGYQGLVYTVTGPDTSPVDNIVDGGTIDAVYTGPTPLDGMGNPIAVGSRPNLTPWPIDPAVVPPDVTYQIIRRPMRTSDQPLTLPDGIVIDLEMSGMGLNNTIGFAVGSIALFDPIITFTPNGSVGHLVTTQSERPSGPIFLLLGRRELMSDVSKSLTDENFYQPNVTNPPNLYLQNFWLTIGHQTGLVTTAEVARNPLPPNTTPSFLDARSIAITSQSVGGR